MIFTLDDPYIHLSLAENLVRGHYGVNLSEVASPSSSILYPFLLAGLLALGVGDFAPMVLNTVGALGVAWLLAGFLWDALAKNPSGKAPVLAYFVLPFMLLAVNGYALTFTGMEHTLHVWASLAILRGLCLLSTETPPRPFLLIAILAAPLLRFEGLALAGAALVAIALWGYWLRAAFTGGAIVAALAGYMALMSALNLPLMPSSVLVKSGATAAAATSQFSDVLHEFLQSLKDSLAYRQGKILTGLIALLVLGAALAHNRPQARTVAIVATTAALGHMIAGRWDWFSRYEIYIMATAYAALLVVWAPLIGHASRRITTPGLLILALPIAGYDYLIDTVLTPKAARNIYEQQYQMHRFAVDHFPEPVAVIDLGWVTYRNDNYALDLWGLGSETARTLFATQGRTPEKIRTITSGANVSFAMLYEEVFTDGLPEEWCLIAQLETIQQTAAFATVEFFLIDPVKEDDMRTALSNFAPTLPEASGLTVFDCP